MEVSIDWGIQNGWLLIENPIKVDDLGVPLCQETTKWVDPVKQWNMEQ